MYYIYCYNCVSFSEQIFIHVFFVFFQENVQQFVPSYMM